MKHIGTTLYIISAVVTLVSSLSAGQVCFTPSSAVHYNAQGHAGYIFAMPNPNAHLVLETKGNPGLIVCNPNKTTPDFLDNLFPNTGC
jgi:hypothetical protein